MLTGSEPLVEYVTTAQIGARGHLVVPKECREALGLDAGSFVTVLRIGSGLVLVPEEAHFRSLCEAIASALGARRITAGDLQSTLPEVRRRVFARHYPRLAGKMSTGRGKRGKNSR